MRGKRSKWGIDGYKITMGFLMRYLNVVLNMKVQGRWQYTDRDNTINPEGHDQRLKDRLGEYSTLSPEPDIQNYVAGKWEWMDPAHLRWYDQNYSFDPSQLDISQSDGKLRVITEGPVHTGTYWEIPLLREDADLLTEEQGNKPKPGWRVNHQEDAIFLHDENLGYADGGGRRPFSIEHHYDALAIYSSYRKPADPTIPYGGLTGTSFFNMAYDFNLMPIGTMGHELPLLTAGIWGYEEAYPKLMELWIEHFGKAGYLLPDTFTTPFALKFLNERYANFFMGMRHDSYDPYWFTDLVLQRYRELGVDPSTKTIIFSNSLYSRKEMIALRDYLAGKFKRSYLLGKFITNRCGHKPRNTVSKLVAVKVGDGPWKDVAKVSDDLDKAIGASAEVQKILAIVNKQN